MFDSTLLHWDNYIVLIKHEGRVNHPSFKYLPLSRSLTIPKTYIFNKENDALFFVNSLYLENHGPCSIVATSNHRVFFLHPSTHN